MDYDYVCRLLPYCKEKNCASCESVVESTALWRADVAKRKLEQQPKLDKAATNKALKLERKELAKESKSRCVKCFEVQDIDCFRISPSPNYPDRRAIVCIECDKKKYLERRGEFVPYKAEKAKVAALLAKGMQFCNKCGIEKPFDRFKKCPINKGTPTDMSTGYVFDCKECKNEATRIRSATPEKIIAREQRAARSIEVAKEKEEKRLRVEQRDAERAHPDYKAGQRKKERTRSKSRMKTDPAYRIKITLRSRIRKLIKGKAKVGSHIRDLGCSVAELKIYLESKFKRGMTWENHGKVWHIDHIIALSTFDLTVRAEYLKAVHYTNLQPLTIKANLEKGNRNIDGQQFCLI